METGAGRGLTRRRVVAGFALGMTACPVMTWAMTRAADDQTTIAALGYLTLVVASALVGGRWPAGFIAVVSAGALNAYFTAPTGSLRISEPDDVAAVVFFLVVGIAVATLVDREARGAAQARDARAEADALIELNKAALAEGDVDRLLVQVARIVGVQAVALDGSGHLRVNGPVSPGQARALDAFETHLVWLAQRAELERQTALAVELENGNKVRTTLLAAVSHDLRTPLAGIKVAVSTLRRGGSELEAADREVLEQAVEESADRLSTIVTNLLDLTRLRTGGVELNVTTVAVEDLIARSLVGLPRVDVSVAQGVDEVSLDPGLTERVLANLVANAVQHGGGEAEVNAARTHAGVEIRVVDHGPGVALEKQELMFRPFERFGVNPDGIGLGLAVARGLAEAQGLFLTPEATPGGGLTVVLTIPKRVAE